MLLVKLYRGKYNDAVMTSSKGREFDVWWRSMTRRSRPIKEFSDAIYRWPLSVKKNLVCQEKFKVMSMTSIKNRSGPKKLQRKQKSCYAVLWLQYSVTTEFIFMQIGSKADDSSIDQIS